MTDRVVRLASVVTLATRNGMELLKLFKRADAQSPLANSAALLMRGDAVRSVRVLGSRYMGKLAEAPLPRELAAFRPIRADHLERARQVALMKVFQNIPKPPELFLHLLDPDFVQRCSDIELVETVHADARLVDDVLREINSPAFGLRAPVNGLDEAVVQLGTVTIRGLCLQRLLMRSFVSISPERQHLLDDAWQASALAMEIGMRQAKALGYVDSNPVLSLILLACVGRLATLSAMPGRLLAQIPARGYLARACAEQAVFGLSAAEMGRMLMHSWGLPTALADEAAEVEAVLFAPYAAWDADRAGRLGLCYLSLRLGERLAHDAGSSLEDFDLLEDPDPELHHVRAYLQHPEFAAVDQQLGQLAFRAQIDRLRLALLTPRHLAW